MVSVPGNYDHHHYHSNYKGYSRSPGPVAPPAHSRGERAMYQLLSRHRGRNSEQDSTVLTHTGPCAWVRCYLHPGTGPQLMLPPYRQEEGVPASIFPVSSRCFPSTSAASRQPHPLPPNYPLPSGLWLWSVPRGLFYLGGRVWGDC